MGKLTTRKLLLAGWRLMLSQGVSRFLIGKSPRALRPLFFNHGTVLGAFKIFFLRMLYFSKLGEKLR